MKYPSQNASPIPSIIEGYKRNSVVKLHNRKAVHLCKTEIILNSFKKTVYQRPLSFRIQVEKNCSHNNQTIAVVFVQNRDQL